MTSAASESREELRGYDDKTETSCALLRETIRRNEGPLPDTGYEIHIEFLTGPLDDQRADRNLVIANTVAERIRSVIAQQGFATVYLGDLITHYEQVLPPDRTLSDREVHKFADRCLTPIFTVAKPNTGEGIYLIPEHTGGVRMARGLPKVSTEVEIGIREHEGLRTFKKPARLEGGSAVLIVPIVGSKDKLMLAFEPS